MFQERNLREELRYAIWQRDERRVTELLAEGADPNTVMWPGTTDSPLLAALSVQHHHLLDLLLAAGADPNRVLDGKPPALHKAACSDDFDAVIRLLDANADPLARDEQGRTLWELLEHQPRMRALIEARGGTPEEGIVRMAKLDHAIRQSSESEVLTMLEGAADLKDADSAPLLLIRAVNYSTPAVVERLLQHGFPVRSPVTGGAALSAAAENGSVANVLALLDAGARADERSCGLEIVPLHALLRSGRPTRARIECAELLIAAGSPVSETRSNGDSMRGAARGNGYDPLLHHLPPLADEIPIDPQATGIAAVRMTNRLSSAECRTLCYRPNSIDLPLQIEYSMDNGRSGSFIGFRAPWAVPGEGTPWDRALPKLTEEGFAWLEPLIESWIANEPLPFGDTLALMSPWRRSSAEIERFDWSEL